MCLGSELRSVQGPKCPVTTKTLVSAGPIHKPEKYFVDLESLSKDTNAVQYWLSKEPLCKQIRGWL